LVYTARVSLDRTRMQVEERLVDLACAVTNQDGVEVLSDGRLLVTSWADSTLFVMDNGKKTNVASGIASPADIGLDGKRVAVPQLMENKVQFWELP